jgi:hypothetical protein
MTNRIPRKSATRIATVVACTVAVCLAATLAWYRLSATNSLPPDALQPSQYSSLPYSGGDLWHAFPGR